MNQIIKIIAVLLAVLACWRPALGQTIFTEVGVSAGVSNTGTTEVSSSPNWVDFDNDGWQDLFVNSSASTIMSATGSSHPKAGNKRGGI